MKLVTKPSWSAYSLALAAMLLTLASTVAAYRAADASRHLQAAVVAKAPLSTSVSGDLQGWDTGDFKKMKLPPAVQHNVAAMASMENGFGLLALLSNGTVIAWGGADGKVMVPKNGTKGVKAIAAGFNFGLALLSNGTVVALKDLPNPIPLGKGLYNKWMDVPHAAQQNIVAISTGAQGLCMALTRSGDVVIWGEPDLGPIPGDVHGRIVAIAGGNGVGLLLLDNGTVVALSTDAGMRTLPAALIASGAQSISCAGYAYPGWCAALLKGSGRMIEWIPATPADPGRYPLLKSNTGKQPAKKAIKAVSIGSFSGLALIADGSVELWYPSSAKQLSFTKGVKKALAVYALNTNSFVITKASTPARKP